jgi:hypothetical protein
LVDGLSSMVEEMDAEMVDAIVAELVDEKG